MPTINMFSSADKVKGQGVGSAYIEQVNLVKNNLKDYDVNINKLKKAEITHYHTIDLKYYLGIPFAKSNGKTVGYVHFIPETIKGSLKLPRFAEKVFFKYIINFYKKMDYLVTVNPNFIPKLVNHGLDREKILYIPNFVSKQRFYEVEQEKKDAIRAEYKISKDKFVVLSAGQVQTRKGVMDFVNIAKRMPEIQFVWAGGFSFGNITDGYKELKVVVDNPPDNVLFTGIVDREKMNDLFNMCDVYFMPSYNELFPMAILEAMNTNTPILLRDLDVYKNILFDYYAKGNTDDEFIDIIERLKEDCEFNDFYVEKSKEGAYYYSEENVTKLWKKFYDMTMDSLKGGN